MQPATDYTGDGEFKQLNRYFSFTQALNPHLCI